MKKSFALLFLIIVCTACLQAENRHAFYLAPDGSATWVVLEEDVRSDEHDAAARAREESEYLRRARQGMSDIAIALHSVGGRGIETNVVRGTVPYSVWTEARFESAAEMLETFLEEIGFEAEAALRFEGDRTTLSFSFRESALGDGEIGGEHGPAGCLVEPMQQYRFVLTEGEFVEATGFRILAGNVVAVMVDPDETDEESEAEVASYGLTWVAGRRK